MMTLFRNALVYENGTFVNRDMLLDGASLSAMAGDVSPSAPISVFDNIVIYLFFTFCNRLRRDIQQFSAINLHISKKSSTFALLFARVCVREKTLLVFKYKKDKILW